MKDLIHKNKKFKLFDMNRDGKGVDPGDDTTPNLGFFFKQLWRKLSKIITLNIYGYRKNGVVQTPFFLFLNK